MTNDHWTVTRRKKKKSSSELLNDLKRLDKELGELFSGRLNPQERELLELKLSELELSATTLPDRKPPFPSSPDSSFSVPLRNQISTDQSFKESDLASPCAERLDPSYYRRSSTHFTQGRVFAILCSTLPCEEKKQNEVSEYSHTSQSRAYRPESMSMVGTSRFIPIKLAGDLLVDALGDTGAKRNFMDDRYATSQANLVIDRNQTEQVVLGSGEVVTTTGITKTTFRFPGEKEVYTQLFHLLPRCHHKVILGNRFLKMTRTFTDNVNCLRRVVTRTVSKLKAHNFFYIGGSGPSFKGLVNGDLQYALADTGAKLLLMDEDYAQELGLFIRTEPQHRTRVQFADETTAMTSGMAYDVSWQWGDGEGETHMLDFHILKNAPANVILSEDFLLGDYTNAFADYACYMVDEEDDDAAGCFVIDIDYSYVSLAIDTPEYREQFETVRRGEEDDWVDSLFGADKVAAQAAVNLRRAQWDPTQPLTGANAMNVVPPQFRQTQSNPKTVRKRLRFWLRKGKSTA